MPSHSYHPSQHQHDRNTDRNKEDKPPHSPDPPSSDHRRLQRRQHPHQHQQQPPSSSSQQQQQHYQVWQQQWQQQQPSPRDPSGKRVTQQGAQLIVDEVASLTTRAEAEAAAAAAAAAANKQREDSSVQQYRVTSADTLDGLIHKVDVHRGQKQQQQQQQQPIEEEVDKYRSVVAAVLSPATTATLDEDDDHDHHDNDNDRDDTVDDDDEEDEDIATANTPLTVSSNGDEIDDENGDEKEYRHETLEQGHRHMNTFLKDPLRITMDTVRSLSPCATVASPLPSTLTLLPPSLAKEQLQRKQRPRSFAPPPIRQHLVASERLPNKQQQQQQQSKPRSSSLKRQQQLRDRGIPTTIIKTNYKTRDIPVSPIPVLHPNPTFNTVDSGNTHDNLYHIMFGDYDDGDVTITRGTDTVAGDGMPASDYWKTKQKVPYCCLIITSLQVLVLMLQLTLCGVAPLTINPMIGPFPDAFSEWGGKNPYLMMVRHQYWRFVTPAALHVGVLHLLLNAYCQLDACAILEREWASLRWLIIYVLSEVGCILISSINQPDTFAVGSTGAIMGLLGAKCSQALSHIIFDVSKTAIHQIRLEQMSGILCHLALLSVTSFVTYIDWSGHVGGLCTGFLLGMVLFCKPIDDVPSRVVWCCLGLLGLALALYVFGQALIQQQGLLDAELADPCNYFRRLFPEGYNCECLWGV